MNIADQVETLKERIRQAERQIAALTRMAELLPHIEEAPDAYADQLDFNRLPRASVVAVMQGLAAGKWTRTVSTADDGTLDYTNETMFPGVKVRLWAAEPPPSCRVVECEELVPEHVVPAQRKIVKKVICEPAEQPA